jgi:hypothetical protein
MQLLCTVASIDSGKLRVPGYRGQLCRVYDQLRPLPGFGRDQSDKSNDPPGCLATTPATSLSGSLALGVGQDYDKDSRPFGTFTVRLCDGIWTPVARSSHGWLVVSSLRKADERS